MFCEIINKRGNNGGGLTGDGVGVVVEQCHGFQEGIRCRFIERRESETTREFAVVRVLGGSGGGGLCQELIQGLGGDVGVGAGEDGVDQGGGVEVAGVEIGGEEGDPGEEFGAFEVLGGVVAFDDGDDGHGRGEERGGM